jgi:hypothetical protein
MIQLHHGLDSGYCVQQYTVNCVWLLNTFNSPFDHDWKKLTNMARYVQFATIHELLLQSISLVMQLISVKMILSKTYFFIIHWGGFKMCYSLCWVTTNSETVSSFLHVVALLGWGISALYCQELKALKCTVRSNENCIFSLVLNYWQCTKICHFYKVFSKTNLQCSYVQQRHGSSPSHHTQCHPLFSLTQASWICNWIAVCVSEIIYL